MIFTKLMSSNPNYRDYLATRQVALALANLNPTVYEVWGIVVAVPEATSTFRAFAAVPWANVYELGCTLVGLVYRASGPLGPKRLHATCADWLRTGAIAAGVGSTEQDAAWRAGWLPCLGEAAYDVHDWSQVLRLYKDVDVTITTHRCNECQDSLVETRYTGMRFHATYRINGGPVRCVKCHSTEDGVGCPACNPDGILTPEENYRP